MRERGCGRVRRTSLQVLGTLFVLAAMAPTALTGCVIVQGDGSGLGGEELTPLPDPAGGYIKPFPQRSPVQEKRWGEGQQKAAKWYHDLGYVVLKVTQGSRSGDIIDWIDPDSVVGSDAPPPPPMPAQAMALPEGVGWERMELEDPAEARGPAGTIPFVRPLFLEYVYQETGATSLDDWIKNHQVIGNPAGGGDRLYGGIRTELMNRGAAVSINSFAGDIQPLTLSVHEVVVGCRKGGEMWVQVGLASVKDYHVWGGPDSGDSVLRLDAEFLTAGDHDNAKGKNLGGWSRFVGTFVPARGTPYPLGASFDDRTLSTVGGTQYESLYQIELKEDGNWWVGHNGNWLGYYPAVLFTDNTSNLFSAMACEVDWYNEVYAPVNSPDPRVSGPVTPWTWTDMASGHFAEEGFSNASYFRDPVYLTPDGSGTWSFPPVDPNVTKDATPYNPACYTRTPIQTGASPWDFFFYADGPGRDNPLCQ